MALFGRYEYVGELGRGSTGRVVLALDRAEEDAPRALKVVGEESAGRLLWEFSRLSRVEHRRVARVRELLRVERAEGLPFALPKGSLVLVEDRAPGVALSRVNLGGDEAHERRLSLGLAAALGTAEGLSAIHDAGLVHGDVKPDNVLWDEERGATVIDLGFAQPASTHAAVRGTPRFMAPELLAGVCTPAADVYALGALLFDWLEAELSDHPSSAASGEQGSLIVVRDVNGMSSVYPEALRRLLASFLERDPELRPADGRAALHALLGLHQVLGYAVDAASIRFASAGDSGTPAERAQRARTLPFVGQRETLNRLAEAVETALEADELPLPIHVTGPRGAGHSRMIREAVRLVQERRAQAGRSVPTSLSRLDAFASLRDVDAVLWLERSSASVLRQALRAQAATVASGRRLALIIEGSWPAEDAHAHEKERIPLELASMSAPDFAHLLGRLVSPHRIERILEAANAGSAGLAGRLCQTVAKALLDGADLGDPTSYRVATRELDEHGWSPRARELACWLAWTTGLEPLPHVLAAHFGGQGQFDAVLDELRETGAIEGLGLTWELLPELARGVRARGVQAWHALFGSALAPEARAGAPFLEAALGQPAQAVAGFSRLAASLLHSGSEEAARAMLHEAVTLVDDAQLRLELAELERKRAHYALAQKVLVGVAGDNAQLFRAELARLAGDHTTALRELTGVTGAPYVERAAALAARLAYDRGDVAEARRLLPEGRDARDGMARTRGLEVDVLLALSSGHPDTSKVAELVDAAERLGATRALSRALALRAQVALHQGDRESARRDLKRALLGSEGAHDLHEAATYGMNLGLLELDAGNLHEALESLRAAAYALALIDRPADLSRVLFNLGNAALLVGDDERAHWTLKEAASRAASGSDSAVRATLVLAQSELSLRRGALEEAHALLAEALRADLAPDPFGAVLWARLGIVELLRGELDGAARCLAEGEARDTHADGKLELSILGLRLKVARGDASDALKAAERIVMSAREGTPFALRVSVFLAASDAARAAGVEARVLEWNGLCRGLLEHALAGLSPALRARMRKVPAYARVLASQPAQAVPDSQHVPRWRALVRGGRRLFGERRPARVAQRAAELALDLVHAERALLVLEESGGALRVLARAELSPEQGREIGFSQSVVRRVWLDHRPVISLEAARDERFDGAQSVHRLSVRSVLAVPVLGFAERAVLYLDDRLRGSAFGPEEQALLSDLSELTRQALSAGQAVVREQRRALQAAQQERRLARQLASLANRPPASLETPFVGASVALTRLTERARRVAQADVPILITGQSGTGKELVARFVHAESPRKAGPFVAENCAALPDTLLESALFGHVRGAFTGADRARRGLFELADGGTLLLDEVAEMSPALQGKLLRVLQEGELRVLGSEKVRHVNVRVIAASHRDLALLVREGKFREDLYYRLAVVTLDVPSLAERREDIPLLVQHFVQRHAGERPVKVSPEAMRLFEARSYPGNVRQLENEVRRALALCDGSMRAHHVEEPVVPSLVSQLAEGLDLHAQTESLTRKLVEAAMARTGGNVSQAAQLLGISRFGLQKILKRLTTTQRK